MRRSQVRILIGSLRSQVFEVSLFLGKNKVELQWQVMVVLQQPVRDVAQLVAHLVWDQRVARSSRAIPTELPELSTRGNNHWMRLIITNGPVGCRLIT